MTHLSLCFLGTFEVILDGKPVTAFEYDKVRALLAYLAIEANRPHRRDRLSGLLWPERHETSALQNLSQALYQLRRAIADREATPPFLVITPQTIQFNPASDYSLDVTAFTDLLDACQAHDHSRLEACDPCLERLQRVVALYRGDFLEGFSLRDSPDFEDWAVLHRERLARLVMETLGHLADCYEGRSQYGEALQHAWRQVTLDPWREDAQRQLMRLLALSGQRAAALDQYEACRRLLAAEMGIEPAGETRRLAEQIRAGRLGEGARVQRGREEFFSVVPYHLHPPAPPPSFVARDVELGRLNEFLQATLGCQGRVVFVTGDAGQGKTAMLQEFARRAQVAHPDLIVAGGSGNAHIGPGDPYRPFREILGLLTGDVEASYASGMISQDHARRLWSLLPLAVQALLEAGPDLIDTLLPGPALLRRAVAFGPTGRDWLPRLEKLVKRQSNHAIQPKLQQPDLFDQVTRVLATLACQKPLLLLLDDLQWTDSASLNLLLHLGRRIAGQRILLLGAYRPVEVSLGRDGERHPLKLVVNELKRRFGDLEVDLSQAEDSQFVDAYLDTEPNQLGEAFRRVLRRQTRGQPLFTVELLRAMQARGDLVRDIQGDWVEGSSLDWDSLPGRVEAVIAERIDRLPEPLREALTIASVEGDTFTAEVLAQVQGVGEQEMVRRLSDKLERVHRLVSAQGVQHKGRGRVCLYRFRHILFQKYLYQQLSQAERAYLHQAIGIALEDLYEEQSSEIAVRLARHFQEAGMAEKAIDYLRQAGERAARLSAHQEAVAHFRQGLRWLETLPEGCERARLELSLSLGLAMSLQAITGYGDPEVGRLYTWARLLCDQVADSDQRYRVLCLLSLYYLWQSEVHSAHELGRQLLELAERDGAPTRLMLAHYAQGWSLYALGELASARAYLEQAIDLYDPEQHHRLAFGYGLDPGLACMIWLSCVLWLLGYPDQALKRSREAIALAQELAHPFSLALARFVASFFYAFRRDMPATQEMAEACINLSVERGFPYWVASARMLHGWALIEQGQTEAGIAQIRQGKADYKDTGSEMGHPYQLALLASGYGKMGQAEEGLVLLGEALETVDRTGERYYEAEIHRLKGELLQQAEEGGPDASPESPEACFLKAIEVARRQQARSLELRATTSLCRLWQQQGRTAAARQILERIYSWFTEGFDTVDLKETRALLESLT